MNCAKQIIRRCSWAVAQATGRQHPQERVAKGMTQLKLAELADLNIRNVQRIEAGETDLLLSTSVRIRKALKCSWERLMPADS